MSYQIASAVADDNQKNPRLASDTRYRTIPIMSDLKTRVAELLAEKGLSQAEASRRGGFPNTAFINDILRGHKKSVRGENLPKLAKALDTSVDNLLYFSGHGTHTASVIVGGDSTEQNLYRRRISMAKEVAFIDATNAPEIDRGQFPRDIPLRGIAACGEDASFILNGETGDYVRRPPGLSGRRSVYALNVFGDSMYPVYRHNALVYVDPNQTPSVTEDAIIELHPEDPRDNEPGKGFLKRVKAFRGRKIICEQFNPPEEIVFDRDDLKAFHRVLPWEEVLGY